MHRVAPTVLGTMLLITSLCQGQSLANAARENRKQKEKDGAHNVASGASAKIDYRFDHGAVFQFAS